MTTIKYQINLDSHQIVENCNLLALVWYLCCKLELLVFMDLVSFSIS